jgi:hypothetical protein
MRQNPCRIVFGPAVPTSPLVYACSQEPRAIRSPQATTPMGVEHGTSLCGGMEGGELAGRKPKKFKGGWVMGDLADLV